MSTWAPSNRDRALPGASDLVQVACFGVGGETYALDIMRVKEIVNPVPIAGVPHAPAFIEGVITLRGAFLALIDLRKRFGLAPAPPTRESKYIVVSMQGQHTGLIVDRVIDVRRIARADISAVPALAVGPHTRFLAGVARWDEGMVWLVDLDEVLSASEKADMAQFRP